MDKATRKLFNDELSVCETYEVGADGKLHQIYFYEESPVPQMTPRTEKIVNTIDINTPERYFFPPNSPHYSRNSKCII